MARPDITKAQAAREAKYLDTVVNFASMGLMTRRQFIHRAHADHAKIVVHRERQYDKEEKLDRDLHRMAQHVPFGNPSLPETKRYYELGAQLKAGIFKEETLMEFPNGLLFKISKTEIDYFHRSEDDPVHRSPVSPVDFYAVKIVNRLVSDYDVPEQKALHLVQRMESMVRRAYEQDQSVGVTAEDLLEEET